MQCRGAWVYNCCCYSRCCTHTLTSSVPLRIRISWLLHFLPHFSLLLLTRSHFLYKHNAWVIKRTAGHIVEGARLWSCFPPPLLLIKTQIPRSFKDNVLHKAQYWSNGILWLGEEVTIHVKFPSTHFKCASNLAHMCLETHIHKCFTEQAPSSPQRCCLQNTP